MRDLELLSLGIWLVWVFFGAEISSLVVWLIKPKDIAKDAELGLLISVFAVITVILVTPYMWITFYAG